MTVGRLIIGGNTGYKAMCVRKVKVGTVFKKLGEAKSYDLQKYFFVEAVPFLFELITNISPLSVHLSLTKRVFLLNFPLHSHTARLFFCTLYSYYTIADI